MHKYLVILCTIFLFSSQMLLHSMEQPNKPLVSQLITTKDDQTFTLTKHLLGTTTITFKSFQAQIDAMTSFNEYNKLDYKTSYKTPSITEFSWDLTYSDPTKKFGIKLAYHIKDKTLEFADSTIKTNESPNNISYLKEEIGKFIANYKSIISQNEIFTEQETNQGIRYALYNDALIFFKCITSMDNNLAPALQSIKKELENIMAQEKNKPQELLSSFEEKVLSIFINKKTTDYEKTTRMAHKSLSEQQLPEDITTSHKFNQYKRPIIFSGLGISALLLGIILWNYKYHHSIKLPSFFKNPFSFPAKK